eukprot:5624455-Pyramimonas_sp.AAC.1
MKVTDCLTKMKNPLSASITLWVKNNLATQTLIKQCRVFARKSESGDWKAATVAETPPYIRNSRHMILNWFRSRRRRRQSSNNPCFKRAVRLHSLFGPPTVQGWRKKILAKGPGYTCGQAQESFPLRYRRPYTAYGHRSLSY